jgi:hypothetical protein
VEFRGGSPPGDQKLEWTAKPRQCLFWYHYGMHPVTDLGREEKPALPAAFLPPNPEGAGMAGTAEASGWDGVGAAAPRFCVEGGWGRAQRPRNLK